MSLPITRTYQATPEEIGRLRKEIRESLKMSRETGNVICNTFLKAATLDNHSWLMLRQRLRPAELKLLDKMCGR